MITGDGSVERRSGLLCALLLCLWAAPYAWLPWSVQFPPMQDLPAHAEIGYLLAHVRAGDPAYSDLYAVHALPWPNSLGYELMNALAPSVGGQWNAARAWIGVYAIAWPLSVAALAVALGRSPWLAFLALPTVLCFNWPAGFYNYLIGKPLTLLAVALAPGFARSGAAGRGLLLAAALVVVLCAHALAWLYAMAGCGLAILLFAAGRQRLLRQWPLLLAAPAALPYWLAESTSGGTQGRWEFNHLSRAVSEGWLHLGNIAPGYAEEFAYAVSLACWLALWILAPAARGGARARAGRLLLLALGALLAATYAWGPLHLPLAHVIVNRHVALLFVLLLLLPEVRIEGIRRAGLVAAMGIAVCVHVVGVADTYRRFQTNEMAGFDEVLEAMPRGARLAAVWERVHTPHTFARSMWHWPKLHTVLHDGTTNDSFSFLSRTYVVLRGSAREAGMGVRRDVGCEALRDWDLLLVHGSTEEVDPLVSGCSEELTTRSEWHLLRITAGAPAPAS